MSPMTALGRILIVDDEQPVLDILSEYFAGQGYAVQTASSGVEALAAVARGPSTVTSPSSWSRPTKTSAWPRKR
jgi:CheY-like chemotaxis protein